MCKDNEGNEHKIIRSIEVAPEPMCVLSTDQQLLDLERFCTKEEFCIISVDPTFNLIPRQNISKTFADISCSSD